MNSIQIHLDFLSPTNVLKYQILLLFMTKLIQVHSGDVMV